MITNVSSIIAKDQTELEKKINEEIEKSNKICLDIQIKHNSGSLWWTAIMMWGESKSQQIL
jgi:hypothetical protein